MRIAARAVAAVVMLLGIVAGQQQVTGEEVLVNLVAEGEPVREVAARITEQSGTQIAVTADTESSLTGKLENRTVEDSARLLAEASQASWMRAYILEMSPPEEPYSAEELLDRLRETRDRWLGSLTNTQRQALFGRMMGSLDLGAVEEAAEGAGPQGGFSRMLSGPGGAVAVVRTADGGVETDWNRFSRYEDRVQRLLLPERSETVTLELTDASVEEALAAFTMSSRFFVAVDEQIDGTVTLSLDDVPLSEALAAIAEAAEAQWRVFYVVNRPQRLSDAQFAQREQQAEEQITRLWGEFWKREPQERNTWVQMGVLGIEEMSSRMQTATPENRATLEEISNRAFDFMVGYSTQLTPEQRLELKPILQALARMRAN